MESDDENQTQMIVGWPNGLYSFLEDYRNVVSTMFLGKLVSAIEILKAAAKLVSWLSLIIGWLDVDGFF